MTEISTTVLNREPKLVRGDLREALKAALSESLPVIIRESQLTKLKSDAKGFSREELGIAQISVTKRDDESEKDFLVRTASALDETGLKINAITITGANENDDVISKVLSGIEGFDAFTSSGILKTIYKLLKGTDLVKNTVMVIVLPDKNENKEPKKKKSPRRRIGREESGSQEGDMQSAVLGH